MKQLFFDKNQAVVIKVFPNAELLEREACGAGHLSGAAIVPKIEKLDQKVAKISLLLGFLGYQITDEELNAMVAGFLLKKKPGGQGYCVSIFKEIAGLKRFFAFRKRVVGELEKLEDFLADKELFPVHGDLQKQNIVIVQGQLGLIDFEHFIFAPQELEFCNSLFFDDGNCLDVAGIVGLLPPQSLDKKMLKAMARFYALRQISLGMDDTQAKQRLAEAGRKIAGLPLGKKSVPAGDRGASFCYI